MALSLIPNGLPHPVPGGSFANAMLLVNGFRNSNAGSSFYLSANSGANWISTTPGELTTFSNTGSFLRARIDIIGSSDAMLNTSIDNIGVYYNLY
jgi:hypothetical protein